MTETINGRDPNGIINELVRASLLGENVRMLALVRCAAGRGGEDDSMANLIRLVDALVQRIEWLLTVAGGQDANAAINILETADLARQVDDAFLDTDRDS